jgi:hypothetical protein
MAIIPLKWTSVNVEASIVGNMEGHCCAKAFERRETFLSLGKFL